LNCEFDWQFELSQLLVHWRRSSGIQEQSSDTMGWNDFWKNILPFFEVLQTSPTIYLHLIFQKLQVEISNWIFFQVWTGFSPVKFKFEKNLKIPVRIVKNVLSKWTKCRYCLVNAKNKNAPSEKLSPQCVLLVSTVVQLFDQKEVVEMTIRFQSLFEFYYQGWVRKTSLNESNSLLQ
jgi:CRISPR/Cas system-associated endonuclease/helicase Cas3